MPNKRIIQAGSAEDIELDMTNILHAKRSTGMEDYGQAGGNNSTHKNNYRNSNRADNSGSDSDDGEEFDIHGRPQVQKRRP